MLPPLLLPLLLLLLLLLPGLTLSTPPPLPPGAVLLAVQACYSGGVWPLRLLRALATARLGRISCRPAYLRYCCCLARRCFRCSTPGRVSRRRPC